MFEFIHEEKAQFSIVDPSLPEHHKRVAHRGVTETQRQRMRGRLSEVGEHLVPSYRPHLRGDHRQGEVVSIFEHIELISPFGVFSSER